MWPYNVPDPKAAVVQAVRRGRQTKSDLLGWGRKQTAIRRAPRFLLMWGNVDMCLSTFHIEKIHDVVHHLENGYVCNFISHILPDTEMPLDRNTGPWTRPRHSAAAGRSGTDAEASPQSTWAAFWSCFWWAIPLTMPKHLRLWNRLCGGRWSRAVTWSISRAGAGRVVLRLCPTGSSCTGPSDRRWKELKLNHYFLSGEVSQCFRTTVVAPWTFSSPRAAPHPCHGELLLLVLLVVVVVVVVAGPVVGLARGPVRFCCSAGRHEPLLSPLSMPHSLDVSVPERRCSSCYLGRLWPQKYLVSSHSVKWNWLFIGFPLYGCHRRRLFPPSLFSACQSAPHSYRQPLALINTNHCVTAHAWLP